MMRMHHRAQANTRHSVSRWLLPCETRLGGFALILALFILAACSKSNAPSVQGPPKPDRAVDIQVLQTNQMFEGSKEVLTFAAGLAEGGFLAATSQKGGSLYAYKLSNTGAVLWRTRLGSSGRIWSGGTTGDSRYWLGGSIDDPNSDSIQLLDANGSIGDRQVLTQNAADRRLLLCAAERGGTYLQVGVAELAEYARIPVPSVSATRSDGTRLWDYLRPFDQDARIAPWSQYLLDCTGMFVTRDDHVLSAQMILVWRKGLSAEQIVRDWSSGRLLHGATLMAAFDLKGHETAHERSDNTKGGLLIPAPNGAVLISTSVPGNFALPPVASSDQHVHIRWLDSSLRDVAPQLELRNGTLDIINAAYATPRGGLVLAGCSGTSSRIFVLYVSADRSTSPKHELPQLRYCGGSYWLAAGRGSNTVLLLASAAPTQEPSLTSIQIPE
jgi:hypothetical protein